MRSTFSLTVFMALAALSPDRCVAAGPPPADFPQACAPSYCVQVLPTYLNIPGRVTVNARATVGDETLTMELGNGLAVAFHARYVEGRLKHGSTEARWQRTGSKATAWTCLRCGAVRGKDAVLGIAVTGISSSYDAELSGLSVCFWPLDMSAAGYGNGTTMRLGERICIDGKLSIKLE